MKTLSLLYSLPIFFWALIGYSFFIIDNSWSKNSNQTHFEYHDVSISRQSPGNEQDFFHRQWIGQKYLVGMGLKRTNRFNLVDSQLSFTGGLQTRRLGMGSLTYSRGKEGTLLAKQQLLADHYLTLNKQMALTNTFTYREYFDSQLNMFTTGIDYEHSIPLLTIWRAYLTNTKFDQTKSNQWGGAGMIKIVLLIPSEHQFWISYSSGREGILRSSPPQKGLVTANTIGVGTSFSLAKKIRIIPEFSQQQYPDLDLKIVKWGVQIELRW